MPGVTKTEKKSKLKFGIKAVMVKPHILTGFYDLKGILFLNGEFNLQHKMNFVIEIFFTSG